MSSPVLSRKRGYGDRVARCEIDYFCIGESEGDVGREVGERGPKVGGASGGDEKLLLDL
jgi:hypothetical protein